VGASGDLAPLAHMALPLIGEGEAYFHGELLDGGEAMRRAGLTPITLAAKEGLALTNGTSVMNALGVLEAWRADQLSRCADAAGCLSLEALHGTDLAFDARIHALRPFPRQVACAAYLRQLLHGSQFTRHHDPHNVQDAYTLRCIPQVHGAVRDAIAYALWAMQIELNAVSDNPLIFVGEEGDTAGNMGGGEVTVLSGGNFHGEPLAVAMDYLGFALADLGNISERRVMRLTDEASNTRTLPAFLTDNAGLNSGFMIAHVTAAALASENKSLAHPASVDSLPTSANQEDHVSMATFAARRLQPMVANVAHILAIEWLCAAQGVEFLRPLASSAPIETALALLREHVPALAGDRYLGPDIERATRLVRSGAVSDTLRGVGGPALWIAA